MLRHLSAILALSASLSGCATSQAERNTLWDWTVLGTPVDQTLSYPCQDVDRRVGLEKTAECLSELGDQPRPVVVFMHGCGGPNQNYVEMFRKLGYVVVAPNSMVRDGRKITCPTNAHIVSLRLEEVKLTLERLKSFKWVDGSRLVLAGFSEGGITTAKHPGKEFKARIIFGWYCNPRGSFALTGLEQEPALALIGARDEYNVNVAQGDCGVHMRDAHSRSIVYPNAAHDVLATGAGAEATAEVKRFLEAVLK